MRFHRSRWALSLHLVPLLAAWVALAGSSCVRGPDGKLTNAIDVCALATNGSRCDDLQPCTDNDRCVNQKCVGTPVADHSPCTDGNLCTGPDQCLGGVCIGPALVDGTSCTDDDPCTDIDTCRGGVCRVGAALVCDDHDSCTVDSCVAGLGCVFAPRECAMVDAGADVLMSVDVRPDLPIDAGIDAGAGEDAADAGADATADTPDAGGPDLMATPPDFRARGGGCECTVGGAEDGREAGGALMLVGLLAAFLARRRRLKICASAPRR